MSDNSTVIGLRALLAVIVLVAILMLSSAVAGAWISEKLHRDPPATASVEQQRFDQSMVEKCAQRAADIKADNSYWKAHWATGTAPNTPATCGSRVGEAWKRFATASRDTR
jgi:hypothetical protein